MPIAQDVFNTSLAELENKITETYLTKSPLLKHFAEAQPMRKLTSPWYEFAVITDDPGAAITIRSGNEAIVDQRVQSAVRGNAHTTRVLAHFAVPLKDFDEADGQMGLKELLNRYPVMAVDGLRKQFNIQLARGAHSAGTAPKSARYDLSGLFTLNGAQTYRPTNGIAQAGFFEQAEFDSQTNQVFGLDGPAGTTPTVGWANQFAEISSMDNEGLNTLRDIDYICGNQGIGDVGGPGLGIADGASYLRILDLFEQFVRTPAISGDVMSGDIRAGIKFSNRLTIYREDDLDLSDLTAWGGVVPGLVYMLDNSWQMLTQGKRSGLFEIRPAMRLEHTEAVRYEIVFHGNPISRSRRTQAMVIGTATA